MLIATPHSTDAASGRPRLPLMTALGPAAEVAGLWVQEIEPCDPAELFSALADAPGIAFLDSAAVGDPRGGCSYLCVDPVGELIVEDAADPELFERLRMFKATLPTRPVGPLPFTGGIVGMLSYDAGRERLGVRSRHERDTAPGLAARSYDFVVGFDHCAGRAFALVADRSDAPAAQRFARWRQMAQAALPRAETVPLAWRQGFDGTAYRARLDRIAGYLAAGDIYQANLSARFVAARPAGFDTAAAYLRLRARSPNPFGAFLDLGAGRTLLSASPERFVSLAPDGLIQTRPIKGTAPRFADPGQDRSAASALAASGKDWSENLMICDLLRNDLATVSMPGSVRVPQLAQIERFASVWHLVSVVEARLKTGSDAIDLLEVVVPGGSITGAPKKRACEIIDELEDGRRGAMFGTAFRIGTDGALDSSIIIRSMLADSTSVTARAGGGIVAESEADAEYAEMRAKIAPLLDATGAEPLD